MLWALMGRLLVQLNMLNLPVFSWGMRQHCSHGGLSAGLEFDLRMSKDCWEIYGGSGERRLCCIYGLLPYAAMSQYGHFPKAMQTQTSPDLVHILRGQHRAQAVSTFLLQWRQ